MSPGSHVAMTTHVYIHTHSIYVVTRKSTYFTTEIDFFWSTSGICFQSCYNPSLSKHPHALANLQHSHRDQVDVWHRKSCICVSGDDPLFICWNNLPSLCYLLYWNGWNYILLCKKKHKNSYKCSHPVLLMSSWAICAAVMGNWVLSIMTFHPLFLYYQI